MVTAVGDREVVGTLGVGAVTTTVAVRRHGEPVRVAKRLLPRFRTDEDARARLAREAEILRRLEGRGAPRFVDAGEDALGPYLVMEWLALPRLSAHVSSPRPERLHWVALASRAAMSALAAVHDADDSEGSLAVIHADLSPDNVLVADDARSAAVVDFGLSRWRGDRDPPSSAFQGTLAFVAPEVARGRLEGAQSDLFALAASLLATASGEPPRRGSDFPSLLATAAELAIDDYAERASLGLPPEVSRVLAACVRFEARDRPSSARDALARMR